MITDFRGPSGQLQQMNEVSAFNTELLVLQPTKFCNIDCRYCYLSDRDSKSRMEPGTVVAVLRNLHESGLLSERLTVVWHAGEPLVVPIEFYEKVFPLVSGYGGVDLHIVQAIQTNLTLLTEAHCELFHEHRIHVGVSLDGPEFLHDQQRVTRSGRGTFSQVMNGIELLKMSGLDFNVICVLTRESLRYPNEMYDFFSELGAREIAFNIDEQEGTNTSSSFGCLEATDEYKLFMRTLFYRIQDSGKSLNIREFRQLQHLIDVGGPLEQNNQVNPFAIISVDTAGDFSSFSPELLGLSSSKYRSFTLGNVHAGRIIDCVQEEQYRHIAADITEGVDRCREECDYFYVCGGGAPSNKYFEKGSLCVSETNFCKVIKQALTDVYLQCVEEVNGITSSRGYGMR